MPPKGTHGKASFAGLLGRVGGHQGPTSSPANERLPRYRARPPFRPRALPALGGTPSLSSPQAQRRTVAARSSSPPLSPRAPRQVHPAAVAIGRSTPDTVAPPLPDPPVISAMPLELDLPHSRPRLSPARVAPTAGPLPQSALPAHQAIPSTRCAIHLPLRPYLLTATDFTNLPSQPCPPPTGVLPSMSALTPGWIPYPLRHGASTTVP